jgi:predicted nucleic acid-binding protein
MMYILDANVFIEAHRRYYAFDIAPPFWASLVDAASAGRVGSIDWVKKELDRGNDELTKWADNKFAQAFARTDGDDVIQSYGEIMEWVQAQGQFSDGAKDEFADGADGWLIAYARVNGYVIVTHEEYAPEARRKIPIPNVCREFGVQYLDTFKMLRNMGVRFT